ncbi:MAG: hypothetical protein IJQ88_04240 [Clostridia bacterium]|nr:hypothetical protein [Clostridia bacterium]
MWIRPTDENGDVLPVLHTGEMFSGALAVASLVESRLNLYSGDWWENPAWGNEILRMLQEGRLTNADVQALSTYLTEYVRETSGVQDVMDVRFSIEGHRFGWECTVLTVYGEARVDFEV